MGSAGAKEGLRWVSRTVTGNELGAGWEVGEQWGDNGVQWSGG